MADEARLNELLDLVEQARAEGDKDTEAKATAAYKRESAPVVPTNYTGFQPPQIPMNPLGFNAQGGLDQLNTAAGVTADAKPTDIATMIPEVALQTGTGMLGSVAGGIAGAGQGLWNLLTPESLNGMPAADRVRQVQQAMTYQPRTAGGQALSKVASLPGEAWGAGTNYVGEKATDITGSPLVGTVLKTAGDLAPALIAARLSGAQKTTPGTEKLPKGYDPNAKFAVPTTAQLTKASRDAYATAKDSGVMASADDFGKALTSVRDMVKAEGIDPTLHPKTTAVMKRLEEAGGKPITLQEAETLRKIASDAEDDLNPVTRQPTPDARLAGKVVDELDDKIDALSANDQARALWGRSRRSQMIDQMVHRAEIKAGAHYTQAGMEHALRQEFKQLAMNPRRMRGLTADQRAAIEKVAKGGAVENTLRTLGKFDPTTGGVAAAASIGTGAGLAGLTGGASMGLPLLGIVGRRAATKMTESNVNAAREALVGRGMPSAVQPSKGAPTLPLEVSRALLGKAQPRSAATIQREIDALVQRAGAQAQGPASASARAIWQELALLQAELESVSKREAAQRGGAVPQGQQP